MKLFYSLIITCISINSVFSQAEKESNNETYVLIYCADNETKKWNNTLAVKNLDSKTPVSYTCEEDGQAMIVEQNLILSGNFNTALKNLLSKRFELEIISLDTRYTSDDGSVKYFEFTTADSLERTGMISR